MKLTAKQVWNARAAMRYLVNQQMPSRLAYEVGRVHKMLLNEWEQISEKALPVIKEHNGVVNETTGEVTWTKDFKGNTGEAAYNREFAKLLEAELELPITPIALWRLEEMTFFTPAVFSDLDWLFVDEPRPADKPS